MPTSPAFRVADHQSASPGESGEHRRRMILLSWATEVLTLVHQNLFHIRHVLSGGPLQRGAWVWRSFPLLRLLLVNGGCGWLGRFVPCTIAAVAAEMVCSRRKSMRETKLSGCLSNQFNALAGRCSVSLRSLPGAIKSLLLKK